ncbi:hypothetical protein LCGC14_1735720 [marine sediment metagenome]|uniref:Uncharacterized protein n=1 Tax=marine sediment metagenome TaxID=412755 RepID=A0A0F9K7X7_9ZZZZ
MSDEKIKINLVGNLIGLAAIITVVFCIFYFNIKIHFSVFESIIKTQSFLILNSFIIVLIVIFIILVIYIKRKKLLIIDVE